MPGMILFDLPPDDGGFCPRSRRLPVFLMLILAPASHSPRVEVGEGRFGRQMQQLTPGTTASRVGLPPACATSTVRTHPAKNAPPAPVVPWRWRAGPSAVADKDA